MSPTDGNLIEQIEPNNKGSQKLGKLIAHAIEHQIPESEKNKITVIRFNQENECEVKTISESQELEFKSIESFIQQDRYRHIELLFAKDTFICDRIYYAYEFLAGKQFDNEYSGLYAFGLLDLSFITIVASYLWRQALNEKNYDVIRFIAGVLSGPILILKHTVAFLLVMSTFIFIDLCYRTLNLITKCFSTQDMNESLYPELDGMNAKI